MYNINKISKTILSSDYHMIIQILNKKKIDKKKKLA